MDPPSKTLLLGVSNFRFLRQTPATSLPWRTIHWELWLRSQSLVSAKKPQTPENTGKLMHNLRIPRGFCFPYHRGGDYMGCSFKHDCFKCEGSHRVLTCNFRAKTGRNSITEQRCNQTSLPFNPVQLNSYQPP